MAAFRPAPDSILNYIFWPCLFGQLMHPPPVTLLSIYLYGLCSTAYAGKAICILVVQQVLRVLLLYVLLQGGVCACQSPGFVKLGACDVQPANARAVGQDRRGYGNSVRRVSHPPSLPPSSPPPPPPFFLPRSQTLWEEASEGRQKVGKAAAVR